MAQSRVGTTPAQRLDWAIRLGSRDLNTLTPGDWANLRLELTAFADVLIRQRRDQRKMREGRSGAALFSHAEVREVHREFSRIIGRLLRADSVTVGTYEITLSLERWPASEAGSSSSVRLTTTFPPGTTRATHVLAHLLGIYGHLVKECPAPALRRAPDERCGRWFLARRPNQVYCGARCQSRATTRASRATSANRARPRQLGGHPRRNAVNRTWTPGREASPRKA